MTININAGAFAGYVGELVEAGGKTSKVRVSVFGRETVVEIPNECFASDGEAFDVFASFEKDIINDRRWEAGEATRDWWLEQEGLVSAKTWVEHLERDEAVERAAKEEGSRILQRLKDELPNDSSYAQVDAHFREHESAFRPFRVRWRARQMGLGGDQEEQIWRVHKVKSLQRVAFRAWWALQPRPTEGCRELLEAVWSGKDYHAMTAAEYEAFDRWGLEAVELSFNRWRDEPIAVRELDSLPAGHPWREFIGIDPGEAVRQYFASIASHAPQWTASFAQAVRVIYTLEAGGEHYLVYACDMTEGYEAKRHPVLSVLVGGPPLDAAQLTIVDERLTDYVRKAGWKVPPELRELYAIHHGLGRFASWAVRFDNAGSIYPAELLSVRGEVMNSIAKEQGFQPDGYRFDDLLTFFEDGMGNGQNFLRRQGNVVGTVDWDHETREISFAPSSFWSFLEESPMRWWFGETYN